MSCAAVSIGGGRLAWKAARRAEPGMLKTRRRSWTALFAAGLVLVPLATAGSAHAAGPYTVNSSADPGSGGCTVTECTLREAINDAKAAGTTPTTITITATGTIGVTGSALPSLPNQMTINGPGADLLAVNGNGISHVFLVPAGFTDTITDLTAAGGVASSGGGIEVTGTLTLINSTIDSNGSSGAGGGIRVDSTGNLTILGSTISRNEAGTSAGGISNAGQLIVDNSTIAKNTAFTYGGGIDNYSGTGSDLADVNSTTITDNTSGLGGGGGGGGGVSQTDSGTLTLSNTIIAGNHDQSTSQAPDCLGNSPFDLSPNGYNMIGHWDLNCDFDDSDVTTKLNVNPLLGTLGPNGGRTETVPLQSGSPAIDGAPRSIGLGGAPQCMPTDQRGLPRNGTCDIGAFEVQPAVAAAPAAAPTPTAAVLPVKKCKKKHKRAAAAKKRCKKKR
jgi:CSLREA domain-containing protein